MYCPNTKCPGKLCLLTKTFQSLGRSDYQCPQCASVCQVRNVPFEDQTNSFSCRLVKAFTFLMRTRNQFKIFLEMCIVLVSIVPTERNAHLLVVIKQLRDPFMLVESVEPGCLFTNSFYVTRARKDDKNQQNTFFLC